MILSIKGSFTNMLNVGLTISLSDAILKQKISYEALDVLYFCEIEKWIKLFVVKQNFSWPLVRCQNTLHNATKYTDTQHQIMKSVAFSWPLVRCQNTLHNATQYNDTQHQYLFLYTLNVGLAISLSDAILKQKISYEAAAVLYFCKIEKCMKLFVVKHNFS